MGVCFLCDTKLYGELTQVCSKITPHSNVQIIEKIAEVVGDKILDIVTPADHICKICTSIFTRVDKVDNYVKHNKNEMLSKLLTKYVILLPDQPVTIGKINAACMPVETATKLLKTQQLKQPLYRCHVCSKSFDSRIDCLDHIQKDQNELTPSTSNAEKGIEDSRLVTSKVMKPEPPNTQENNQQVESPMDVVKNPQDKNKGTADIDMLLNDYVPTEVFAYVEQGEETENSQEDKTANEAKSEIIPESAQKKAAEENVEVTAVLGQEEADQETPDSVKKEFDEDNENVEKETGLLNMESMLAAIHNDNPTNN